VRARSEQACDAIYGRRSIKDVRRLVIDESRLPPGLSLFRIESYPDDLIVRAPLAGLLLASDLEAFNLQPTRR
jgi:hypothetical protein